MQRLKKYILVILIFTYLIYIIFSFIKYNSSEYILFGPNTIVNYKNDKIKNIKYNDKTNSRLNYEKFYLYNNEKFDEYYINFNKIENVTYSEIYNKNNEKVKLTKPLLAYKGNLNLKVGKTKLVTEITEEEKYMLSRIVDQYDESKDYIYFSKNIIDIDNDNEIETIYSIDNYSSWNNDMKFCINFLQESDGTIIEIDRVIEQKDSVLGIPRKIFTWAIDIDFDDSYDIVLSSTKGDDSPTYYEFYKYDNKSNKITKIK